MQIRIGYELVFECTNSVPMVLMLNVHPSRRDDLVDDDVVVIDPAVQTYTYRDGFDNICTRFIAPTGRCRITADAQIRDGGFPDIVAPTARQTCVEQLPNDTLVYLLGSRYCETDRLSKVAWDLFGNTPTGWSRVQAIVDYVHRHIRFSYAHARPTKTAFDVFEEQIGVCRDYTHLAIALCRCMNIPARYCTGYVSDVGMPPPYAPMDFAAWFEAYLDGQWYVFDPRNYVQRFGRILIARGRDAADVAISNSFGPSTLTSFKVWTDKIEQDQFEMA